MAVAFKKRLPESVLLSAIGYRVQESDGMIVFSSEDNCGPCYTRFTFERQCLCWYVEIHSEGGVMVSHVEQAHKLVVDAYGENHYPK